MSTPITEASNSITEEIDVASPSEIVTLLEKCDQEIFDGYKDYKSIFSEEMIKTIDDVSEHVIEMLQEDGSGLVVFSGCGTSGRLGFMVARTFNELQRERKRPEIFRYLIAGGDKALFTSQEAPEDDPHAGIEALKKISEGKDRVLYIGITCGLSAPFVAGQLEYCMDNSKFVPVLLGFNPEHLARNIKIENWDKTFLQGNYNLSPDPITGSSRMKCGTATKLLLETICLTGLLDMYHSEENMYVKYPVFVPWLLKFPVDTFYAANCFRFPCACKKSKFVYCLFIESLIAYTAPIFSTHFRGEIHMVFIFSFKLSLSSLRSGGNIYYIGDDSLAIMGLIDASECPPTYGATLDDVRGFVANGYKTLQNVEGDLSHLASYLHYIMSETI
ncbi:glucokinase regulatory protein-like [Ruditapes philippinarum]|uniref:glucokinase regulatory protein-like n=1 Tax=Ruditapes philippinarum TaxID=129788 RepID=UPI00295AC2AC|nr:glucokinase regulatory protein-like [Ruditapes philippinarum]